MRASSELTISAGATAPITAAQMPAGIARHAASERRHERDRRSPDQDREETEHRGARRHHREEPLDQVEERRRAVVADHVDHRAERALHRERGEGLVSPERLIAEQGKASDQPDRGDQPDLPRISAQHRSHHRSASARGASPAASGQRRNPGLGYHVEDDRVALRVGRAHLSLGGDARADGGRDVGSRRGDDQRVDGRVRRSWSSARRWWAAGRHRGTGRPSRRSCRG